ncbi:MAG: hypothetical protein HZC54_12735 [Verrucomicrobia bacterium]|nr:hypothetical protein [Verrucomicrobiota bacterium]
MFPQVLGIVKPRQKQLVSLEIRQFLNDTENMANRSKLIAEKDAKAMNERQRPAEAVKKGDRNEAAPWVKLLPR